MAQVNPEFEQITAVLLQPWQADMTVPHPVLDGGAGDQQWFQLIEQLEFRILLAYALTQKSWAHSSKRPVKSKSPLTRHSVRQCQLMLNAFVVKHCSKPLRDAPDFPFRQVMESLLLAKSYLAHDPAIKQIMRAAVAGLQSGSPVQMPQFLTVPDNKIRSMFKYFTVYGVIMGWVSFDGKLKDKLTPFDPQWLHEEDGVLLSLLSYSLLSKNMHYNLGVMLKKTADSLKSWPNLESIYSAISMSVDMQLK